MCPKCKNKNLVVKAGFYIRKSDSKRIQRFLCRECKQRFSEQIFRIDYRYRKNSINQKVFRLLCKGVSQRGCAMILDVMPSTIARRVNRFGKIAKINLRTYRSNREKCTNILFDEMESFEHSKCKPLTIPIAVEGETRKILALHVGKIAAKGHLAKIALQKYGYRPCERAVNLDLVLSELKACCDPSVLIKSDESNHYPARIKKYFPESIHKRYKGKRGCVVGQGELKKTGFDPLFSLNHTYAMIRDNLKRLTRKTWCTTKRIDRLENMLNMYAWFHNLSLDSKKRPILEMGSSPFK